MKQTLQERLRSGLHDVTIVKLGGASHDTRCLEAADALDLAEKALEWIAIRCPKDVALEGVEDPDCHHAEAMYDAGERARTALKAIKGVE